MVLSFLAPGFVPAQDPEIGHESHGYPAHYVPSAPEDCEGAPCQYADDHADTSRLGLGSAVRYADADASEPSASLTGALDSVDPAGGAEEPAPGPKPDNAEDEDGRGDVPTSGSTSNGRSFDRTIEVDVLPATGGSVWLLPLGSVLLLGGGASVRSISR